MFYTFLLFPRPDTTCDRACQYRGRGEGSSCRSLSYTCDRVELLLLLHLPGLALPHFGVHGVLAQVKAGQHTGCLPSLYVRQLQSCMCFYFQLNQTLQPLTYDTQIRQKYKIPVSNETEPQIPQILSFSGDRTLMGPKL
jgi:hypothetical protein